MRIGFDIDGVLANFNTPFIALMKESSGRDLFPPNYRPHTWNYPEALGYTSAEVSTAWELIKSGCTFWELLPPLPGLRQFCDWFYTGSVESNPCEFYFVTSRMGQKVKLQTENWLDHHAAKGLTVLISSEKGAIAKALKLDFYVDDRAENIADVVEQSPSTRAFLLDSPWNQHMNAGTRIYALSEFLDVINAGPVVG
mgnify:CR=1 FL=1